MDAFDILLRIIGGFYVFAALVAMRAAVMDRMMDMMLSAISLKPQPAEEAQRRWLWAISALAVGMGGAALAALNIWAVPLFAVGLMTQVFYLIWARSAFVPENSEEEKGRQQTLNAALLYAGCTALVLLGAGLGRLADWLDPLALVAPATGIFILATVGRNLVWSPKQRSFAFAPTDDIDPPRDPAPDVKRVRLEPLWIGLNLTDLDTNQGVDPWDKIDDALATRIYEWSLAFKATDDETDQRVWAEFASREAEALHRAEGDAIVGQLTTIFGPGNAEGPVYPADIRYIG